MSYFSSMVLYLVFYREDEYDDVVYLHGEPLLIILPVPDFSMPFNVICLVCTSIAIFYGNVVTMTTKLYVFF